MPPLRPPVLLRRSADVIWAFKPARLVALLGAASLFLWMFLAAAPLETLADSGGLSSRGEGDVTVEAYRFAADWRHGMAGNSPLYMPGFLALALAAWFWARRAMHRSGGSWSKAASSSAPDMPSPWSAWAPRPLRSSRRSSAPTHLAVVAPWPAPPWRASGQGLYTAATWMAFVAACRRSLARRSFAPLLLVPPMTIALAVVRPWTVDDFVALWITRATAGDATAIGSAAAIPIVVWFLVRTEWSPHWDHTQRKRSSNGRRPLSATDQHDRGAEQRRIEAGRGRSLPAGQPEQRRERSPQHSIQRRRGPHAQRLARLPSRDVALDQPPQARERNGDQQKRDQVRRRRTTGHEQRAHQEPDHVRQSVQQHVEIDDVASAQGVGSGLWPRPPK